MGLLNNNQKVGKGISMEKCTCVRRSSFKMVGQYGMVGSEEKRGVGEMSWPWRLKSVQVLVSLGLDPVGSGDQSAVLLGRDHIIRTV